MPTLKVVTRASDGNRQQYANLVNRAFSETAASLLGSNPLIPGAVERRDSLISWYNLLQTHRLIHQAVRVVPYSAELKTNISPYCRHFSVKPVARDVALVSVVSSDSNTRLVAELEHPFHLLGHPLLVINHREFVKFTNNATGRTFVTTSLIKRKYFSDSRFAECDNDGDTTSEYLSRLRWLSPIDGQTLKTVIDRDSIAQPVEAGATIVSQIYDPLGREISVHYNLLDTRELLADPADQRCKFQKLDYFNGREAKYCNVDILKMLQEADCYVDARRATSEWGFYKYPDKPLYWRQCRVTLLDLGRYRDSLDLGEVTEFTVSSLHSADPSLIAIPDSDLAFNNFLTLFNPFCDSVSDCRLEIGVWSPMEMYARRLLIRLYQMLRPSKVLIQPFIIGEMSDAIARTSMHRATEGVDGDVAKLGLLSVLTGRHADYRAAFKHFHNKVVKPLQHNINFFTQYASTLSCQKLGELDRCPVPLSDFDVWILDESMRLKQQLTLDPESCHNLGGRVTGAVSNALEIIPAFVKKLSKYYVRYFRAYLKGARGADQQCRAIYTLAHVLLRVSVSVKPFATQLSADIDGSIKSQIANISCDPDPLDNIASETVQAAKDRIEWVIDTVNQLLSYRARERLDIKHPIRRLVILAPERLDTDKLRRWQNIIEDETNCLTVDVTNNEHLNAVVAKHDYRRITDAPFWVYLEWNQACSERHAVRTLISNIQRFRRHVGVKMTDDRDIGIVTCNSDIRGVVERNREYLARMLLVEVKCVEPNRIGEDTKIWRVQLSGSGAEQHEPQTCQIVSL